MDETTTKWFDPSDVKISGAPSELMGWITHDQLVRLSGAPSGSTVSIAILKTGVVQLTIDNPVLFSEPSVRLIGQRAGTHRFEIRNSVMVLRDEYLDQGIGPRSVAIEIAQASELDFLERIVVNAVGDWKHFNIPQPLRGYYVWPRMGFDGPIPSGVLTDESPKAYEDFVRVSQFMETQAGRDYWKRNGTVAKLQFDLEAGCGCQRALTRYLEEKGIKVSL